MSVQGIVHNASRQTRSKRSAHPDDDEERMSDAPQHVSKHAKAAAGQQVQPLAPTTRVLRNISNQADVVPAGHGKQSASSHAPVRKAASSKLASVTLVEEHVDDNNSEAERVLTRAQAARAEKPAGRGASAKKGARASQHSSSSTVSSHAHSTRSAAAHAPAIPSHHHPLTRNQAKAMPVEEDAVEEQQEEDEDAVMTDNHAREDSQQPGMRRKLRKQAAVDAEDEEEDDDEAQWVDVDAPIAIDAEQEDDDVYLAQAAEAATKLVAPHAHHKHATAHLHVTPTEAAVAAAVAENAPIVPAAMASAGAAASAASASAASAAAAAESLPFADESLPFADQATWMQCRDDPCQEYADSIYQHLREQELELKADPAYMETVQGDLTHAMRSILVDWLCEVAVEYKLASQSLFLAVDFLDRFLSRQAIDRSRLQLVGVTALLLAAKYWEIWPPAIDEFVYISDHTYTKAEVLHMESTLLQALKFKLTSPTSWEFSRRFCKAAAADKQTECLVDYLLELMLQESACLNFRPSCVAASALFLALYTLHKQPWSERLETHTGIRVEELQQCVRTMHAIYVKMCCGQHSLRAIKDKYAGEQYCKVSTLQPRNM